MTSTQSRTPTGGALVPLAAGRRMTPVSNADTVSFLHARSRLVGVARRVLGSASEADDVVQEAWIRWQESDRSVVRDPAAFLTTTTMRLALNVGQSARVRHESDFGPVPADVVDATADPVDGAERRDAVERALWAVLATLSPAERAVYVLREAFDYPHRRIAEILGLSEANVRQVATRARRHVGGEQRWSVEAASHRRLVGAFVSAAQDGDLARLEQTLRDELEGGTVVRLAA